MWAMLRLAVLRKLRAPVATLASTVFPVIIFLGISVSMNIYFPEYTEDNTIPVSTESHWAAAAVAQAVGSALNRSATDQSFRITDEAVLAALHPLVGVLNQTVTSGSTPVDPGMQGILSSSVFPTLPAGTSLSALSRKVGGIGQDFERAFNQSLQLQQAGQDSLPVGSLSSPPYKWPGSDGSPIVLVAPMTDRKDIARLAPGSAATHPDPHVSQPSSTASGSGDAGRPLSDAQLAALQAASRRCAATVAQALGAGVDRARASRDAALEYCQQAMATGGAAPSGECSAVFRSQPLPRGPDTVVLVGSLSAARDMAEGLKTIRGRLLREGAVLTIVGVGPCSGGALLAGPSSVGNLSSVVNASVDTDSLPTGGQCPNSIRERAATGTSSTDDELERVQSSCWPTGPEAAADLAIARQPDHSQADSDSMRHATRIAWNAIGGNNSHALVNATRAVHSLCSRNSSAWSQQKADICSSLVQSLASQETGHASASDGIQQSTAAAPVLPIRLYMNESFGYSLEFTDIARQADARLPELDWEQQQGNRLYAASYTTGALQVLQWIGSEHVRAITRWVAAGSGEDASARAQRLFDAVQPHEVMDGLEGARSIGFIRLSCTNDGSGTSEDPLERLRWLESYLGLPFAFAIEAFLVPMIISLAKEASEGHRDHLAVLGLSSSAYHFSWLVVSLLHGLLPAALCAGGAMLTNVVGGASFLQVFVLFACFVFAGLAFNAYLITALQKTANPEAVGSALGLLPIFFIGVWVAIVQLTDGPAARTIMSVLLPYGGVFSGMYIFVIIPESERGRAPIWGDFWSYNEGETLLGYAVVSMLASGVLYTAGSLIISNFRYVANVSPEVTTASSASSDGGATGKALLGRDDALFEAVPRSQDKDCLRVNGVSKAFSAGGTPWVLSSAADGAARAIGSSSQSVSMGEQHLIQAQRDALKRFRDGAVTDAEVRQFNDALHASQLGLGDCFGEYSNRKLAVAGVDLQLRRGEITALLGHNGSGKTTTQKIITGQLPPTAGEISYFGVRMSAENASQIRRELGVCPQQNVVFDEMTAAEHLQFIAEIKGPEWVVRADPKVKQAQKTVRGGTAGHSTGGENAHQALQKAIQEALEKEIEHRLHQVTLSAHDDGYVKLVGTFSGGMKRKLCIAMALLGGPEVLTIDEGTSGVDPASKRKLWDLLLREKHGRVVLITTHAMDEAEQISNRVMIMRRGRLFAEGKPLFLRVNPKFSEGFTLSVRLPELDGAGNVGESGKRHAVGVARHDTIMLHFECISDSSSMDWSQLDRAVQRALPSARPVERSRSGGAASMSSYKGSSRDYVLPFEEKAEFPALFSMLEKSIQTSNGGPSSTSLTYPDGSNELVLPAGTDLRLQHTTLEQVFVRVSELSEVAHISNDGGKGDAVHSDTDAASRSANGIAPAPSCGSMTESQVAPSSLDQPNHGPDGKPAAGRSKEQHEVVEQASMSSSGDSHSPVLRHIKADLNRSRQYQAMLYIRYLKYTTQFELMFWIVLFPSLMLISGILMMWLLNSPGQKPTTITIDPFYAHGGAGSGVLLAPVGTSLGQHSELSLDTTRDLVTWYSQPGQATEEGLLGNVSASGLEELQRYARGAESATSDPLLLRPEEGLAPFSAMLSACGLLGLAGRGVGTVDTSTFAASAAGIGSPSWGCQALALQLSLSGEWNDVTTPAGNVTARGASAGSWLQVINQDTVDETGTQQQPMLAMAPSADKVLLNSALRFTLSSPLRPGNLTEDNASQLQPFGLSLDAPARLGTGIMWDGNSSDRSVWDRRRALAFNASLPFVLFAAALAEHQAAVSIALGAFQQHGMRLEIAQEEQVFDLSSLRSFVIPLLIGGAFTSLLQSGAFLLVADQEKGIIQKLKSLGLDGTSYWTGLYLGDSLQTLPAIVVLVISILAFDLSLLGGPKLLGLVVLLVLYSLSVSSLFYLMATFIPTQEIAGGVIPIVNLVFGLGLFSAFQLLAGEDADTELLDTSADYLLWMPIFGFYRGVEVLVSLDDSVRSLGTLDPTVEHVFRWDIGLAKVIVGQICAALACALALVVVWNWETIHASSDRSRAVEVVNWVRTAGDKQQEAVESSAVIERTKKDRGTIAIQDAWRVVQSGEKSAQDESTSTRPAAGAAHDSNGVRGPQLGSHDKVILQGCNLAVKRGEAVSVVGPSGAGKTTMINLLSGYGHPQAGEAWIDGAPVGSESNRGSLGMCPQDDPLYDTVTPRQHFHIFAMIKGMPTEDVEATIEALAKPIDLEQHLDTPADQLSGGNKRKLGLASALFGLPPAIVADEVSTGVDPGARRGIWGLIARCRQGSSMVWSTHSMEEAEATGDRVLIMAKGKTLALDTPQRLVQTLGRGLLVDVEVAEQTAASSGYSTGSSGTAGADGIASDSLGDESLSQAEKGRGAVALAGQPGGRGPRTANMSQRVDDVLSEIRRRVEQLTPPRMEEQMSNGSARDGAGSNGSKPSGASWQVEVLERTGGSLRLLIQGKHAQPDGARASGHEQSLCSDTIPLSVAFDLLLRVQQSQPAVTHFSIGQPTLEQVFLRLVKEE